MSIEQEGLAELRSQIDRLRFRLIPRSGGSPVGELTLWEMGTLNPQSGQSAMGLVDLIINEDLRNQGLSNQLVIRLNVRLAFAFSHLVNWFS